MNKAELPVTIKIIDIAAEARLAYGDRADEICGRILPAHEYRFEMTEPSGRQTTLPVGAVVTADQVVSLLESSG